MREKTRSKPKAAAYTNEQQAEGPSEREIQYRIRRAEIVGIVATKIISYGVLAFCVWCVKGGVEALAGQQTAADIGLTGNLQISSAVAWLFGGGGVMYGLRQRKLRRDVIETNGTRVSELESAIDPHRSSSRLTRRGDTNPEDGP